MSSTAGRVAIIYKIFKLNLVIRECYKGLGKLNLGIHKEEDQTQHHDDTNEEPPLPSII